MQHQVEAARAPDGGVALHCGVCGQHGRADAASWVDDMNEFVARHAHGLRDGGFGAIADTP